MVLYREDGILHSHLCENLKPNTESNMKTEIFMREILKKLGFTLEKEERL
jgi:hypothetical protein